MNEYKSSDIEKEINFLNNILFNSSDEFSMINKNALFLLSRKLIESKIFEVTKKRTNESKYIKKIDKEEGTNFFYLWNKINDNLHNYLLHPTRDHIFSMEVYELYNKICINGNKRNNLINFWESYYPQSSWEKTDDSLTKKMYFKYSKKIDNIYSNVFEVWDEGRLNSEVIVYSDYFIGLYNGTLYEISYHKETLGIEDGYKIERFKFDKYERTPFVIDCFESSKKMDNIFDWRNSQTKETYKILMDEEYDWTDFLNIVESDIGLPENTKEYRGLISSVMLICKFDEDEIFNQNNWRQNFITRKFYWGNPMAYEFWTKNPKKASFTIPEKKRFISELEKKYPNFEIKKIFYGEDSILLEELITRIKTPVIENIYGFNEDENGKFFSGHEDYKIIPEQDSEMVTLKYINDVLVGIKEIGTQLNEKKIKQYIDYDPHLTEEELRIEKINIFNKMLENKFIIINGAAGTGKTFLITHFIKSIFNSTERKTSLIVAPMHKSKNLIKDKIDADVKATTVYSLCKTYEKNYSKWSNEYKKDVLIIDEISMISISDWKVLLSLFKEYETIVLAGDSMQLPPIKSIGLSEILFSFDGSYTLKQQERIESKPELQELVDVVETFRIEKTVVNNRFIQEYDNFGEFSLKLIDLNKNKFNFLSPVNNGLYGNRLISSLVNGNSFRQGDIITIDNDILPKMSDFENELHVYKRLSIKKITDNKIYFNESLKLENDVIEEGWEWVESELSFTITDNLTVPFVYFNSQSVHASQGSEYEKVCLIIPPMYEFDEKMIYTAISRAQKDLVILIHKSDRNRLG